MQTPHRKGSLSQMGLEENEMLHLMMTLMGTSPHACVWSTCNHQWLRGHQTLNMHHWKLQLLPKVTELEDSAKYPPKVKKYFFIK